MSQNLTQPEEVDHVLMEMARYALEACAPGSRGVHISEIIREAERKKLAMSLGFSSGLVHKKSARGL